MSRLLLLTLLLFLAGAAVHAEDTADESTESSEADGTKAESANGDGVTSPKTMSGMSILGNEETPKSLVIVPWKSSEMGDAISLSDTLDDRATPVDKEVFMRELRYFAIRSGE